MDPSRRRCGRRCGCRFRLGFLLCARCQAASSRAWLTLQCREASRKAASSEGEATSANGSTRSSDSSPDASPSARQGSDFEVDGRAHPLAGGRRADAALRGDPGDHGDGAVAAPALRLVELGDVGQLLPVQRRDPRRPLHDPFRQLLRAGVATEVAARRPAAQTAALRVAWLVRALRSLVTWSERSHQRANGRDGCTTAGLAAPAGTAGWPDRGSASSDPCVNSSCTSFNACRLSCGQKYSVAEIPTRLASN